MAAVLLSVYCYSQTKGTSALSLGISSSTNEFNSPEGSSDVKNKNSYLRLGYGLFVSDNNKVGIDLLYNKSTAKRQSTENQKQEGYGAGANFQHYFPLVKTLYAYAGASGQYMKFKGEQNDDVQGAYERNTDGYNASLTAIGSLTWFISKRWALESNLISAGAYLGRSKYYQNGGNTYSTKDTNFNLSTDGVFNNLGFRVYLMF